MNNKGLFSRLNKKLKNGIKRFLSHAVRFLFRKQSFRLFGIPSGISSKTENEKVIFPEEMSSLQPAQSIERFPYWSFNNRQSCPNDETNHTIAFHTQQNFSKGSILTLKNGMVTSNGGYLTPNGKLIASFYFEIDGIPAAKNQLFHFSTKRFFPRILETNEEVSALTHAWHFAFYHWVFEVLPRLHLIKKSSKIFISNEKRFQQESLDLLEIEPERIINTKDYDAIKAPSLVGTWTPMGPTRWGVRFLREQILPKLQKKKEKKRLYISRNDALKRRILNEAEVFHLLSKHGFEKVTLSALPLMEQMELFYNAEIIVGPHGAGFTHLLFSDQETKCLEFFSPSYVNVCYWHLANCVSASYFYLLGKGERLPAGSYYRKDPDLEVDMKELEATLKLMKC